MDLIVKSLQRRTPFDSAEKFVADHKGMAASLRAGSEHEGRRRARRGKRRRVEKKRRRKCIFFP
jgi:hypothetical protein